jgi:hypothetical protein
VGRRQRPATKNSSSWLPRSEEIAGLWPWEIEKCDIGEVLDPFEDDFTAVRGDVEVANVEPGWEVGQLVFGAGRQINEPEILMLNFSAQKHECAASRQEGNVPRTPSECERR